MRTIKVTGKGEMHVHPDMTKVRITMKGRRKEYAETLRLSTEDTAIIKECLAEFGFERKDLKTIRFDVDVDYEHYKEKGETKSRFVGYKYSHEMYVEFESDNKKLGKLLKALSVCEVHPEFTFVYFVKDKESAKNKLLELAVNDAKSKASILARSASLVLKDILSIDYSWGRLNLEYRPLCFYEADIASNDESFDIDIEPEDIGLSDTVSIIWEIQ